MKCLNCGNQNADGMRFCTKCGNALMSGMETPNVKKKKVNSSTIIVACLMAVIILLSSIILIIIKTNGGFDTLLGRGGKSLAGSGKGTEAESGEEFEETVGDIEFTGKYLARPELGGDAVLLDENPNIIASVPAYTVAPGLTNVINADEYRFLTRDAYSLNFLQTNGFIVSSDDWNDEFFDRYEQNRYVEDPNFVTVDSLMHTYHLYFSALLKTVEKNYLSSDLKNLSELMLDKSLEQFELLKGTEWESAARRNVGYFAVGATLLGSQVAVPQSVATEVSTEVNRIYAASEMNDSTLFEQVYEDYTQYKPRGFYEGDAQLEPYFRAMMWYGRMPYKQENEDFDRSAVLMTLAMQGDPYTYWEKIYSITSFFCGASDDMGYCEYLPIIQAVYGEDVTLDSLKGNKEKWKEFHQLTGQLKPPVINSIVVDKGENIEIISYRFMGQRFTIDADIMQRLVYPNVEMNAGGTDRMLPSTLDVMAALGSDRADELLHENGAYEYKYFDENMEMLKNGYANAAPEVWSASLYSGWLKTLKPLLEKKGEGYPMFMQSKAWQTKQLETFAGSYAELKHDTILYSKQVMAEMGDGDIPEKDDRGYVEPEVAVYARFANLATKTRDGLKEYNAISDEDANNLTILVDLATKLMNISEKELQGQSLTAEEYELIRTYGGNLEHFWKAAMIEITEDPNPNTSLFPCPVIADVATDPNGEILEIGNAGASVIYVIVNVEGKLKIASGTVYSYYEFNWPQSDRLTDTRWKQMLGMELMDNGQYNYDRTGVPAKPSWTLEYRERE